MVDSLRVPWVPLYRFPTLSLRAFAMHVAFPHSDYYAPSDGLQGLGAFGAGLPCLLPLSFTSLASSPVCTMSDSDKRAEVARSSWPHPLFVAPQYRQRGRRFLSATFGSIAPVFCIGLDSRTVRFQAGRARIAGKVCEGQPCP